jgi:hypothetical protein
MDKRATALRFIELDSGCLVPLSHRLNADGYFIKAWSKRGTGEAEMFHRFIWRAHNGPIPEGHEINHKCGNRACQNVEHLECISGKDHAILTNLERYSELRESARKYWEETRCTGTHLASLYGRTVSSACRWIREWGKA